MSVKKYFHMILHICKLFCQCFAWLDHNIAIVDQILRLFKEKVYQAKVIRI